MRDFCSIVDLAAYRRRRELLERNPAAPERVAYLERCAERARAEGDLEGAGVYAFLAFEAADEAREPSS